MNREMHATKRLYGTSGGQWADHVHDFAHNYCKARTLLDYGCGKGTLKDSLAAKIPEYEIFEYDPGVPAKAVCPRAADVVVCGDVMEHVEPYCIEDVLDDIADIAEKGVFFVIGTIPAMKHLPDGRNAHLVIKPAEWWLKKLKRRWRAVASYEFSHNLVFVGKAK